MQSNVVLLATLLLFLELGSQLALGQAGISLSFRGVSIPNDSYVDIGGFDDISANGTEICDAHALLCHTDKRNCCHAVQTLDGDMLLGNWYFPNGTIVGSFIQTLNSGLHDYFARNRGLSVIRLYISGVPDPTQRGRFRCEIPGANGVTRNLYANILDIGDVVISSSGPRPNNEIIGQPFTLECYTTIDPHPLPQNVPPPHFKWFFGLSMEPLSDGVGVVISSTVMRDGHTYASFLNFSSLHESHAGLYTCQLGGNKRLAASRMVLVTTVQEATGYPFSTVFTDPTTITSDHDKVLPPDIDPSSTGFNSKNNGSTSACDCTTTITLAAVFNISTVFVAVVVITALLIRNKRRSWERQTDSKATTMLSENVAYGTHVNNNRFSCGLQQVSASTQQLPGLTTAGDAEEGRYPIYETIENHPTQLQQLTPLPATNNRTRIKINSYTTPPRS